MVRRSEPDDDNSSPTDSNDASTGAADRPDVQRRSFLKLAGAAATAGALGVGAVDTASALDVTEGEEYDVWTVTSAEVYDLSDGEVLENVLIDQTHPDGTLSIRSQDKSDWEVRNVGFLGVGHVGGGSTSYQFQVSVPSGGHGLIENVWANGKARDGQSASSMGGIWLRPSHAGHIDIRHTYIEGFGNNAVYGSGVGKDGHSEGSVAIENAYHRDNTVSQFRIGSPGSVVRNSVGIVDDPEGRRGSYPYSSSRNARGVWGKHFEDQRIENCSFYVNPDDPEHDAAFVARYIEDRSNGPRAEVVVDACELNADCPRTTSSTSNAEVNVLGVGDAPTVEVIRDGGVPTSPEMAARGDREMPPELPGGGSGNDDGADDEPALEHSLTVDGTDAGWTDYEITVSGDLEKDSTNGSVNDSDAIDGSTVTGFVNGGVDGFRFSGEVVEARTDGGAAVLVDGQAIDTEPLGGDGLENTLTVDGRDAGRTDYQFSVSGEVADNPDVGGLGAGDEIDGDTASGFVNGGVDGYLFSGDVTDVTVDGDAQVLVNGEPLTLDDGSTLDRTLTVDGTDAGWTDYEITVSGALEKDSTNGSVNDSDVIDGSTVTGFVNGGVDGYLFSGDVTDVTVDGDAQILVDGQAIGTDAGGDGSDLPNRLVFDARGDAEATTYAFEVTGELAHDPDAGAPASDELSGSSATGTVDDERAGYRFSGDLMRFQLDGTADVHFEDNDG